MQHNVHCRWHSYLVIILVIEVLFEMQKKEDKNLCLIELNPEQLMKKGLQVIWLIWWSSQSITRSCLHTELGNSHFIVWLRTRRRHKYDYCLKPGLSSPLDSSSPLYWIQKEHCKKREIWICFWLFLQCFSHVEQDKIQCKVSEQIWHSTSNANWRLAIRRIAVWFSRSTG